MGKSLVIQALVILALVYCFLTAAQPDKFPSAQHSSVLEFSELSSWHPVVDHTTNQYHQWRVDPVFTKVARTFGKEYDAQRVGLVMVCLFALGCFVLFWRSIPLPPISAGGLALMLGLSVIYLWGNDFVILGVLAWFPWLTWSLIDDSLKKERLLYLLIVLFFALRLAKSANQLSILPAGIALIIATHWNRSGENRVRFSPIELAIIILPALWYLFKAPLPPRLDYPLAAHLVGDDGLPGTIRPLATSYPSLPVIDRMAVQLSYASLALFGFVISYFMKRVALSQKPLAAISLALWICAALDTIPGQTISHIAPIAVLERTVPGWFHFALSPPWAALALATSALTFAANGYGNALALAMAAIIAIVPAPFRDAPRIQAAKLQPLEMMRAEREFEIAKLSRTPEEIVKLNQVITSPSYSLLNRTGIGILDYRDSFANLDFRSIKDLGAHALSSHGSERDDLRRLFDGRMQSRWSTAQGSQHGNEWLHIWLPSPLELLGIEFSPGKFNTDYPRGLRVSYASECQDPTAVAIAGQIRGYSEVSNFPDWQGSIRFTASGLPYWTGQHEVKLFFPKPTKVQCILAEQIGVEAHFDWSVAEFRVLEALNRN